VERTIREHRVDAVVHLAGSAYVGESMRDPGKYFSNNAAASFALLEAVQDGGVGRVVFSSSCATYGMPESLPIHDAHAQRPINPYGESKLFVERALYWYGKAHGVRSVSLRYFNAAGADPDGELGEEHDPETHLIPLAIGAALGRRPPLQIYGTDYPTPDGTAVRDYVHVTDLAHAHVRALEYLDGGGESTALNLGTGRGHSVLEVMAAIERVARCALPRREAGPRRGDPASLVAAPGRSRDLLGWAPRLSELEAIIATAWRWHAR
jgi:UDP-arabinose 4-epimerase